MRARGPPSPSTELWQPRPPSAQSLVDLSPVHDAPPRADVVGASVLVLQIVRVLPDVDAEHDLLAFHQRTILIRRAFDGELAALVDDPRPPAAETAHARLRH